jgi:processive 1,2-diacylglycerol beta-glucosyltransferase/1,2-diacylglycerol 3-beta-galactosyltransferase
VKKRILFFYLKTGGGHLAPARAIAEYLNATSPGEVETVLVDGMAKAGAFPRYVIEDGYRLTQARAKWIYESAYALMKFRPATLGNSALVARVLRGGVEEAIRSSPPAGIVIMHFFLIAPVLNVLRRLHLAIPTITIVTDPYTAHPLWFLRKKQTMVVFSERVKETAVKAGIPAERIHVFPFLLGSGFSQSGFPRDESGPKVALGFRPDQRVVLLLGGSDGMPRGYRIVKRLLRELPDAGILLVCGRNRSLFRRTDRLARMPGGRNLRVIGYADNVPELIRVSDAVLTKGGASTVMEIIALGKTPVITTYIWEQEKGNVEFVVNEGRGIYEKRISRLPEILSGIFSDAPPYRRIRETNQNARIQSGTQSVSEFVLKSLSRPPGPNHEG